jgi:hypothetical protein
MHLRTQSASTTGTGMPAAIGDASVKRFAVVYCTKTNGRAPRRSTAAR